MKRITPLLLAAFLFGTFATSTGCIVRTRDRHHHHAHGHRRGGPPPKARHDNGRHRGHHKNNKCRWERC